MRLSALGPKFDNTGQGMGSFFVLLSEVFLLVSPGVSKLTLGLVALEMVVAALDDDRVVCGLLSSQLSQASFSLDVREDTLEGDLACRGDAPAFLTVAGVVCSLNVTP